MTFDFARDCDIPAKLPAATPPEVHNMKLTLPIIALVLGAILGMTARADESGKQRVYIGTYTGKDSKGIYLSELDLATGKLSEPTVAAETGNPSFLAIHPNRKFLYAVAEGG